MNWKFYYNYLRQAQKTHTTQEYCLAFLNLTNYHDDILTCQEINNLLSYMSNVENPNFNLFPFSENIKKIIEDGNYQLLAQLIFQLPYIDLTWMNHSNPKNYDLEVFYSLLLGNSELSIFFLNNISIGNMLKKIGDKYMITFLFLLCLPCCEKDTHLWDYDNNHICSYPFISDDNYDLLLDVSNDCQDKVFNSICSLDNNLSIQLIENFMDIQNDLNDFKNIDWIDYIPINQLLKLAKYNCYPSNIKNVVSSKFTILYPNLLNFIDNLSYKLFEHILDNEINHNEKEKQTKITKF